MRRLILVRHAKAVGAGAGCRDFDRPLHERGERDAPEMARRLQLRGIRPQLIVASGARRALTTAQQMGAVFGYPMAAIEIVDDLYDASETVWFERITGLPPDCCTAMIVGHNPEITMVANRLLPSAGIPHIPTCGVLWLEYADADWCDIPQSRPGAWGFDHPGRGTDNR